MIFSILLILGRTGPGVCFRMYSESDFDGLSAYTKPEIQRVPLDSLLLQLLSMGLPDARKFPFLEPPDVTSIEESLQNLKSQVIFKPFFFKHLCIREKYNVT